jgi:hypothetical protein
LVSSLGGIKPRKPFVDKSIHLRGIAPEPYRFARNELNLKSLSLILTDPQPHYDVEMYARDATKSGPRFTGPIGLDGLYRKGEPTDRGVNAVKAAWQDDHTFLIDRLVLGQWEPPERWTLTFEGEKLNVSVKIGERPDATIDSETGA